MSKKSDGICLSADNLKNLLFVLDYIINAEERSYEEYVFQKFEKKLQKMVADNYDFVFDKNFYNKTDIEHIYAIAQRLRDAIGFYNTNTF
jgi:hypothetical protein